MLAIEDMASFIRAALRPGRPVSMRGAMPGVAALGKVLGAENPSRTWRSWWVRLGEPACVLRAQIGEARLFPALSVAMSAMGMIADDYNNVKRLF